MRGVVELADDLLALVKVVFQAAVDGKLDDEVEWTSCREGKG